MGNGICAIATEQDLFYKTGINGFVALNREFRLQGKNQVQLESSLKGDFFNIKDWSFMLDGKNPTNDPLPEWFIKDRVNIEAKFLNFIEEEIKKVKERGYYDGGLYFSDLKSGKGIILPKRVVGGIHLEYMTEAAGIILPEEIEKGGLGLTSLLDAEGLTLPQKIEWDLFLGHLKSARGLVLPQKLNVLILGVTSTDGLTLPDVEDLTLTSLKSAEGLVLPKKMKHLHMWGLKYAKGLNLPEEIDGVLNLGLKLSQIKNVKLPNKFSRLELKDAIVFNNGHSGVSLAQNSLPLNIPLTIKSTFGEFIGIVQVKMKQSNGYVIEVAATDEKLKNNPVKDHLYYFVHESEIISWKPYPKDDLPLLMGWNYPYPILYQLIKGS